MVNKFNLLSNKRFIGIQLSVIILLLIPLVAMQFTNDVRWNVADFLIMGVLLSVAGLLCELVLRHVGNMKMRIFLCVGIIFVLFLVWAEIAVGVFGSIFAGS
ncbi:MAG: hypothetical protein KFH87_00225 [Bacteroidetes bacterium]|nr:hypothetical protein [Bacteroidota bacterium]